MTLIVITAAIVLLGVVISVAVKAKADDVPSQVYVHKPKIASSGLSDKPTDSDEADGADDVFVAPQSRRQLSGHGLSWLGGNAYLRSARSRLDDQYSLLADRISDYKGRHRKNLSQTLARIAALIDARPANDNDINLIGQSMSTLDNIIDLLEDGDFDDAFDDLEDLNTDLEDGFCDFDDAFCDLEDLNTDLEDVFCDFDDSDDFYDLYDEPCNLNDRNRNIDDALLF